MTYEYDFDGPDDVINHGAPRNKNKLFRKMHAKHAPFCFHCGKKELPELLIVDHIIPLAQGGADAFSNTQLLCRNCDGVKMKIDSWSENIRLAVDKNNVERNHIKHLEAQIKKHRDNMDSNTQFIVSASEKKGRYIAEYATKRKVSMAREKKIADSYNQK